MIDFLATLHTYPGYGIDPLGWACNVILLDIIMLACIAVPVMIVGAMVCGQPKRRYRRQAVGRYRARR